MSNQITPNPSVPSQVVAEVKFPKFINNLGIIPTSYKDSMSYYESLAWLCKFLEEQVIPTVNENGEAVEELQTLYTELNSYVTNYFDNLDVQNEINNKLDDMVEAGTLQEIIADYLNSKAIFGFDTVAAMKNATNLINGSYAKTLGFYSINDGGSALYKIRNVTNDDVVDEVTIIALNDNSLIAELIVLNEINIKQFGAYGNNETDDTLSINKALTFANEKNIYNVYIPNGTYIVNGTLILYSYINLYGNGKNQTILKNSLNENISIPMITTNNYSLLSTDVKYIKIHDLTITSNGVRSEYDIVLHNISYSEIYNIYYNRLNIVENNVNDLHGIFIIRDNSCEEESVVNKIYNCQIRNGKIKLQYTTDNYINKNEIWASNCQDCALELKRSFNNSITNNQFVGGITKGCLYFSHSAGSPTVSGNKIENNYFDGSYASVNSTNAITIETNLIDTIILGNLFYHSKYYSIYVNDSYTIKRFIISNNQFEQSNYLDNSYDDIYARNTNNEGNIIESNIFYSNNRTNKGYPIHYECTSSNSISKSLISNNICEYRSGYNIYDFDNNHITLLNNSLVLGPDNDKNYICCQQTASQSFTSNGILNLTNTVASYGNGISLENNKLKINAKSGIKNIKVKSYVLCYGTNQKSKTIAILKNGNIILQKSLYVESGNYALEIEGVVPVTDNDLISIQINASDENTTTTVGSSVTNQTIVEVLS